MHISFATFEHALVPMSCYHARLIVATAAKGMPHSDHCVLCVSVGVNMKFSSMLIILITRDL